MANETAIFMIIYPTITRKFAETHAALSGRAPNINWERVSKHKGFRTFNYHRYRLGSTINMKVEVFTGVIMETVDGITTSATN